MNKFLDEDNIIKKEDLTSIEFTMNTEDNVNTETDVNTEKDVKNDIINIEQMKSNDVYQTISPGDWTPLSKIMISEELRQGIKDLIKDLIADVKNEPYKQLSKQDVLIETLNKLKIQLLHKELDIDIAHYLYKNANSNDERKNYERSYTNLEKDMKILKKKIEYVERQVKNGK